MKGRTFAIVAAVGVLLDQLGKHWAESYVRPRIIIPVIEGFFELRYSRNAGAFFSMGAELPDAVRRGFFVVASLVALGFIIALYRKARPDQRRLSWALCLLASGAVGNLVDRVERGQVVDFLHLHLREVFHWATFNIADIWIAAGLTLLAIDLFARDTHADAPTLEPPASSGASAPPIEATRR